MFTAYVVVTLLAIAANTFSGVAALVHFKPIIPGMVEAGVPESWLTFPIGLRHQHPGPGDADPRDRGVVATAEPPDDARHRRR
jgi:hypothetical protein